MAKSEGRGLGYGPPCDTHFQGQRLRATANNTCGHAPTSSYITKECIASGCVPIMRGRSAQYPVLRSDSRHL